MKGSFAQKLHENFFWLLPSLALSACSLCSIASSCFNMLASFLIQPSRTSYTIFLMKIYLIENRKIQMRYTKAPRKCKKIIVTTRYNSEPRLQRSPAFISIFVIFYNFTPKFDFLHKYFFACFLIGNICDDRVRLHTSSIYLLLLFFVSYVSILESRLVNDY